MSNIYSQRIPIHTFESGGTQIWDYSLDSNSATSSQPPRSVLIVGSGVFGLSTALSLAFRPAFANTTITVLDRSPFPSQDGSSIDSSRIIRADYSDPAYTSLAAAAQEIWRGSSTPNIKLTPLSGVGSAGRYTESGLVLVCDQGHDGERYVQESYENVCELSAAAGDDGAVSELPSPHAISDAVGTGGGTGDWGYINRRSGWADAEASMIYLRQQVEATGRVTFIQGEASSLLSFPTNTERDRIEGVRLTTGRNIRADLTILATGAWTGKLIDLQGRAQATGQVLCYLDITPEEQQRLEHMPVVLNMSTGMFIIPPSNNVLKVARHGYGYTNPVSGTSRPRTTHDDPHLWVPVEGEQACRQALRDIVPGLGERQFFKSKICWYTDTPTGDFLITYHPDHEGLFLATGGSGHGFKFLPVIGDAIADCIEGHCPEEFKTKWAWPEETVETVVTEDGSRGGRIGMVLDEELRKGSRL